MARTKPRKHKHRKGKAIGRRNPYLEQPQEPPQGSDTLDQFK